MRARTLLSVIPLSILLACGGAASDDDASGATADPNAGATATEASAASGGGSDRCAEARFGETTTFAFHDELPFVFEYPTGWDHLGHVSEGQLYGSVAHLGHNGRRSSTGLIQYVFVRKPISSEEGMLRILEVSMEPIGAVTVGGREATVYALDDPGVVNAKFLYPDADGLHLASFIFGSASRSCLEERKEIRDLVLGSIADRS